MGASCFTGALLRLPGTLSTFAVHPFATRAPMFRRTLIRVMAVQVVTLAVLWFLQMRYNH
jgi:hypothetical protein